MKPWVTQFNKRNFYLSLLSNIVFGGSTGAIVGALAYPVVGIISTAALCLLIGMAIGMLNSRVFPWYD